MNYFTVIAVNQEDMDDTIDIIEMNVKWSNFEYMVGNSIVFNFEGSSEEYDEALKRVRRLGRAKIRFTVYAEPTFVAKRSEE